MEQRVATKTVHLNGELHRMVKILAVLSGADLADQIDEAVLEYLERRSLDLPSKDQKKLRKLIETANQEVE